MLDLNDTLLDSTLSVCGDSARCIYKNVCGGLDFSFKKSGIIVLVSILIVNFGLMYYIKYGEEIEADREDRFMTGVRVKEYLVAFMGCYIALWLWLNW